MIPNQHLHFTFQSFSHLVGLKGPKSFKQTKKESLYLVVSQADIEAGKKDMVSWVEMEKEDLFKLYFSLSLLNWSGNTVSFSI